jgi:SAM-dependent methyltransferase
MTHSILSKVEISNDIINGNILAGDNLSAENLLNWYKEEEQAFSLDEVEEYTGNTKTDFFYEYLRSLQFRLSRVFHNAESRKLLKVLCIGPGDGAEVKMIKGLKNENLYFIESSPAFIQLLRKNFKGSRIIKSNPLGDFDMKDSSVDIVLCFSVLHHMPNVSKILEECYRVLNNDGTLLVREPCSSMGDWKDPKRKCTPNERGIPKNWIYRKSNIIGFSKIYSWPIAFLPLSKIFKLLGLQFLIKSKFYFYLDFFISRVVLFNNQYFRKNFISKIAPNVFFYEIKK